MEFLRFHFTDTPSFEQFHKLIREHERRTGTGVDDDVKIGAAMPNMAVDLRNHLVSLSKRLTLAELWSGVADAVRT